MSPFEVLLLQWQMRSQDVLPWFVTLLRKFQPIRLVEKHSNQAGGELRWAEHSEAPRVGNGASCVQVTVTAGSLGLGLGGAISETKCMRYHDNRTYADDLDCHWNQSRNLRSQQLRSQELALQYSIRLMGRAMLQSCGQWMTRWNTSGHQPADLPELNFALDLQGHVTVAIG